MELRSKNGNLCTLTVDGYELPDEELGPTKDNPADKDFDTGRFLFVSHSFANKDGNWTGRFPTMDTTGLSRLVDWLEAIRLGQTKSRGVYFIERCLEFTIDESLTTLSVHLSLELLPPWSNDSDTIELKFPLVEIDFNAATSSLRRQLSEFPGRPPLPNAG